MHPKYELKIVKTFAGFLVLFMAGLLHLFGSVSGEAVMILYGSGVGALLGGRGQQPNGNNEKSPINSV